MTITEYARHRGCALQAVQYAIKAGRIQRAQDGKIDSDQADADWERNTMHSNARYGPKTQQKQGGPSPSHSAKVKAAEAAADLSSGERMASGPDYSKARAAKEIYEARLKKLDFEERLGNLVSRSEVELEAFNRFRVLRDACLNIPNRVSAQIAAETEPAIVFQILEDEVRRVFENFSESRAEPEAA
jgi:hypothetical protein